MKKIFIFVLLFCFLVAVGFVGGRFLAEQRVAREAERKVANQDVLPEIAQEVAENKTEVNPETRDALTPSEEIKTDSNASLQVKSEGKFTFAILGDTQSFKPGGRGGYQTAVASIQKLDPNLVFAVGDLVSSCASTAECEGKLNAWKSVLGPMASKTYPAQGNHDRTGEEKADAAWSKTFSYLPANGPDGFERFAYSLDLENAHFVVLASDKPKENDISKTQLDWLEQNLAKNRKEHVFVFFHEPAYPTNSKIGESLDENPKNRNRLWNILIRHNVAAVFSGHEHIQSRRQVNGVYQFGFGNTESFNHLVPKAGNAEYFHIGQAFGLVEVSGQTVIVQTYSVDGRLLNSFTLPN